MMRKIFRALRAAGLAAAVLAASMLGACAPAEGTSPKSSSIEPAAAPRKTVDISLWTYPIGNWSNPAIVAELLADFNREYPDIRVSVKYLDYNTGDTQVEEAVDNNEPPDLVFEGPERLCAGWGARGLMADLSDLWEDEAAGEIYSHVKEACRWRDGAYYVYPVCESAHCMAIHYDMFKEAGALEYIDEEAHTWTTEGFISAVKALRDHGSEDVGMIYCASQAGDQGTRALVNNLYGGSFTDPDSGRYTVSSRENVRALEELYALEGISFRPDCSVTEERRAFCAGELPMAFCWSVAMEISEALANPDMKDDVFPMAFPSPGGTPVLEGGVWGFGIFDSGDRERIAAAKDFIRFMTGKDSRYAEAVTASTYWPVRPLEGVYENDRIMAEYGVFTRYMGPYHQNTPGWTKARRAWWEMLQKVGAGEDAGTAARAFDEAANSAAESESG